MHLWRKDKSPKVDKDCLENRWFIRSAGVNKRKRSPVIHHYRAPELKLQFIKILQWFFCSSLCKAAISCQNVLDYSTSVWNIFKYHSIHWCALLSTKCVGHIRMTFLDHAHNYMQFCRSWFSWLLDEIRCFVICCWCCYHV